MELDFRDRTKNYLNQVKGSFLYKIAAIIVYFLLIREMVRYLGIEKYGVWSTLLAILSWMLFFDLGLGNGVRNKIAEAIAHEDIKLARIYVSTGYVSIFLLSLVIYSMILILANWINWQVIFNVQNVSNTELKLTVLVTSFFILVNFSLSIVRQVIHATQNSSLVVFEQFLSNFIALILIFLLSKMTHADLFLLALFYGFSLIVANLMLSVFFYKRYSFLIPSFYLFEKSKVKDILGLGIKFFIIQLAVLTIFNTDKIIITQLFGPASVTPYDVTLRLFRVIVIAHSIIMTPLWSTFTEAYARGDYIWIKNVLKKLILLMFPIIFLVGILILSAPTIIKKWIGQNIHISFLLTFFIGLLVIIMVWNNIYAYFVNGISAIKPQLYSSIIGIFTNVPLSIFFAKYMSMGVSGVVLATTISLSFFAIIGPIQTYMILKKES